MIRFDAVVFDFDGVLVESVEVKTRAFAALYAPYGAEIERKVVEYHLAQAGISRFVKFRYFQEVLLGVPYTDEDEKRLSMDFSLRVLENVVHAPFVVGAYEFLEGNYQKLPLFVASATPEDELLTIVAHRGMEKYFVSVYGAPAKKHEILKRIISSCCLAPERVLMVGDAMADFEGALEAGTGFVGRVIDGKNIFPSTVNIISNLTGLVDCL